MDWLERMAGNSSEHGGGGGEGSPLLALLQGNKAAFESMARDVGRGMAAPGYMSSDVAAEYMSKIYNLFPGVSQVEVEMALAKWCILNDVGGTQGFAGKQPIEAGGLSVQPTAVFGGAIPSDNRGFPRQFAATRFEKVVPALLDADPSLRQALTPRAVERGLQPGDEIAVISFVKGGQIGTHALGRERVRAKNIGIASRRGGGAAPEMVVRDLPVTEHVSREVPHNLF